MIEWCCCSFYQTCHVYDCNCQVDSSRHPREEGSDVFCYFRQLIIEKLKPVGKNNL